MIQNILTITIIFLIFQYFFNNKGPVDPRTPDQVLQALRTDNAGVKDLTAQRDFNLLQQKIKESKLAQPDKERLEVQGMVLQIGRASCRERV